MLVLRGARLWQQDWCAAEKALHTQFSGRIRPLSLDSSHLMLEWNQTIPFIGVYTLSTDQYLCDLTDFMLFLVQSIDFLVVLYLLYMQWTSGIKSPFPSYCFFYASRIINIESWKTWKKYGYFKVVWESNKPSKVVELFLYVSLVLLWVSESQILHLKFKDYSLNFFI